MKLPGSTSTFSATCLRLYNCEPLLALGSTTTRHSPPLGRLIKSLARPLRIETHAATWHSSLTVQSTANTCPAIPSDCARTSRRHAAVPTSTHVDATANPYAPELVSLSSTVLPLRNSTRPLVAACLFEMSNSL